MISISYEKLRVQMAKRRYEWIDLRIMLNASPKTIKKLKQNDAVDISILFKLCELFNCDIGDIMEVKILREDQLFLQID